MPVSSISLNINQTWSQSVTDAPFQSIRQGPDSQGLNWNSTSSPSPNYIIPEVYTIAASGTQNIDLTNCTSTLGETVTFTSIYSVMVLPSAANAGNCQVGPNGTNGFPAYGASTTITVPPGGINFQGCGSSATGTTVDSTHKILTITNPSGSASMTVVIVISGQGT